MCVCVCVCVHVCVRVCVRELEGDSVCVCVCVRVHVRNRAGVSASRDADVSHVSVSPLGGSPGVRTPIMLSVLTPRTRAPPAAVWLRDDDASLSSNLSGTIRPPVIDCSASEYCATIIPDDVIDVFNEPGYKCKQHYIIQDCLMVPGLRGIQRMCCRVVVLSSCCRVVVLLSCCRLAVFVHLCNLQHITHELHQSPGSVHNTCPCVQSRHFYMCVCVCVREFVCVCVCVESEGQVWHTSPGFSQKTCRRVKHIGSTPEGKTLIQMLLELITTVSPF